MATDDVMTAFRAGWNHCWPLNDPTELDNRQKKRQRTDTGSENTQSNTSEVEVEEAPPRATCVGYYIGRHHLPYTEVKIVRSLVPSHIEYLQV